jgi:uncharacterized membrane protein YfcA
MHLDIAALLFAAGTAGGIVNALAGGATLITFPAMLAAGLPPVIANASNAVAISPGHLLAAVADREKLPPVSARFLWLVIAAVAGGAVGAMILLAIPPRLFVLPVPALIGFATLLFALAPRLQAWSRRKLPADAMPRSTDGVLMIVLASIYGGFFGAGLGVILTAVVSITDPVDIRAIKALKNILATFVSASAIVIFIVDGTVRWMESLVMLGGALLGGFLGGHLIRVLPANLVRGFVLVAGIAMAVIYARQYWF